MLNGLHFIYTCLNAQFNFALQYLILFMFFYLSLVDDVVCIYYNTWYTPVLTAFVILNWGILQSTQNGHSCCIFTSRALKFTRWASMSWLVLLLLVPPRCSVKIITTGWLSFGVKIITTIRVWIGLAWRSSLQFGLVWREDHHYSLVWFGVKIITAIKVWLGLIWRSTLQSEFGLVWFKVHQDSQESGLLWFVTCNMVICNF